MNFTPDTPLRQDEGGTIRVKGSRVTIDTLVTAYLQEHTFEEIHDSFPTVSLEAIQECIAWYLANRSEVDEYIRKRDEEAEILRREIESQPGYIALREKLLRRKAELTKA